MVEAVSFTDRQTVEVVQQPVTVEVIQPGVQIIEIVERGPQGPPGPVADIDSILDQIDVVVQDYFVLHPHTFTFEQSTPATTWTILHPLDHWPSVSIRDSAGEEYEGEPSWPSSNVVVVEFNVPFAGTATLF